jgi:hypothetical protein
MLHALSLFSNPRTVTTSIANVAHVKRKNRMPPLQKWLAGARHWKFPLFVIADNKQYEDSNLNYFLFDKMEFGAKLFRYNVVATHPTGTS